MCLQQPLLYLLGVLDQKPGVPLVLRASKVGLVVCHAKEGPAEITLPWASAGVLPPDYQASDILDFLVKLRTIYETRSQNRPELSSVLGLASGESVLNPQSLKNAYD